MTTFTHVTPSTKFSRRNDMQCPHSSFTPLPMALDPSVLSLRHSAIGREHLSASQLCTRSLCPTSLSGFYVSLYPTTGTPLGFSDTGVPFHAPRSRSRGSVGPVWSQFHVGSHVSATPRPTRTACHGKERSRTPSSEEISL